MFTISYLLNRDSYANNLKNNERHVYVYLLVPLASVLSMVFILRHYLEYSTGNLYLLVTVIVKYVVSKNAFLSLCYKHYFDGSLTFNPSFQG